MTQSAVNGVWLLFAGKDTVHQCPTAAPPPWAEAHDYMSAQTLSPGGKLSTNKHGLVANKLAYGG